MVMVTAKTILQASLPSELYSSNKAKMISQRRAYLKQFHPDKKPDDIAYQKEAAAITDTINQLYQQGLKDIEAGIWPRKNQLVLEKTNGKKVFIQYLKSYPFELGNYYVSDQVITFVISKNYETFYQNYLKRITLTYPNQSFEEKISRCFPKLKTNFITQDHQYVIVLEKTEDVLPLREVLSYYHDKIPPKHVAWMISRLHNFTCALSYNGLAHNAIMIDTLFVSPAYHSMLLLGGWFYTVPIGEKMIGMPKDVYQILPHEIEATKQSNIQTDLESIRYVGRILLGDKNGTRLPDDPDIPPLFTNYIRGLAGKDAIKEYETWSHTLNAITVLVNSLI